MVKKEYRNRHRARIKGEEADHPTHKTETHDIERKVGVLRMREAQNRSSWEEAGETYAQEWASGIN